MSIHEVNQNIDRLLHDAEHASAGAGFATFMKDAISAEKLMRKSESLRGEAERLYAEYPESAWPECDFPAPARKGRE